MIEVSTGGQREDASTRNFTAKDTEASMRDINHSGVSESSGPLLSSTCISPTRSVIICTPVAWQQC